MRARARPVGRLVERLPGAGGQQYGVRHRAAGDSLTPDATGRPPSRVSPDRRRAPRPAVGPLGRPLGLPKSTRRNQAALSAAPPSMAMRRAYPLGRCSAGRAGSHGRRAAQGCQRAPGPIRPATIPVRPQDQHALLDPLYVAQQVLAWGSDPDGFRSPYDMITDAPLKDATRTP